MQYVNVNVLFLLSFVFRLSSSGSGSASLQELTLLAAARRSAAAAAAAAAATGGSATGGSVGSHPMHGSMGMTSSGGPAELHPAYRLNPYVEHLYSSLHSSPTASLRGLSPLDPRGSNLNSFHVRTSIWEKNIPISTSFFLVLK